MGAGRLADRLRLNLIGVRQCRRRSLISTVHDVQDGFGYNDLTGFKAGFKAVDLRAGR